MEAASSYRKAKHFPALNKSDQELYSYCGIFGHGKRNPEHVRRAKCPAYGHDCELCRRYHNFEQVRLSKDKPQQLSQLNRELGSSHEVAVFDTFCTLFDRPVPNSKVCTLGKTIPLYHHVYDELLN